MLDPGERIRRMKDPVQVRWTAERTERVLRRLSRPRWRSALVPVLAAAAAALAIFWIGRQQQQQPADMATTAAVPSTKGVL